jgi:hypothetical protein
MDKMLEDLRSVSQLACGYADVGPHCVPHQSIAVVSEICRQQRFHGRPYTVNDRTQVPRLILSRPP